MRLVVTVVAFVVTLTLVFIVDKNKTKENEITQNQLANILVSVLPSETRSTETAAISSAPQQKTGQTPTESVENRPNPSKTPTLTSTPTQTQTPTKAPTPRPTKTSTPTPAISFFPITETTPTPTPSPIPPTSTPVPTPIDTPTPIPANYSIESVSAITPVAVKSDTTITAKVPVESICSISMILPSGSKSTAAALKTQPTAGADGLVSWVWSINWNTKPGMATFTITCKKDGQTFDATSQLEITS